MLGHGSSRCKVKTFCAKCAGNHKTAECNSEIIKCANCQGPHKSFSLDCPSRQQYQQITQRSQPRVFRPRQQQNNFQNNSRYSTNYTNDFPNSLNQATANTNPGWNHQTNNNNANNNNGNNNPNNLFSVEEIKNLTFELISKLKNCKCKADQFEVITLLACRFLYE